MYEKFYGLRTNPFTLKTDPSFLYMSQTHSAALGMLEYAIVQHAAFTVVTGEIGSGKTTLTAKILEQIEQEVNVAHLSFIHPDMGSLLAWVLYGFEQDYESSSKIELYDRLKQFCLGQLNQNRRNIVLIDEAQNLTAHQLEEIRTIANLNFGTSQAIQVVFIGQPEFRNTLALPELEQLRQRVSVDYCIEPFNAEETAEYVQFRLNECGASDPIFDQGSLKFIHKLTGGTPRKINIVCDTLLSYGYLDEMYLIDQDFAESAMKDRTRSGMVALGISSS